MPIRHGVILQVDQTILVALSAAAKVRKTCHGSRRCEALSFSCGRNCRRNCHRYLPVYPHHVTRDSGLSSPVHRSGLAAVHRSISNYNVVTRMAPAVSLCAVGNTSGIPCCNFATFVAASRHRSLIMPIKSRQRSAPHTTGPRSA